ncbi:uncharacterized protein LOC144639240 isoform X1 [Oculina patagonica]
MDMTLLLQLLIYIFVAGTQVASLTPQCESIPFHREIGFALVGHVTETISLYPDDCLWHCRAKVNCFSVNVKKIKPGMYLCELNNSTKDIEPQKLMKIPDYEYRGFTVNTYHSGNSPYFRRAIYPDGWYLQENSLYKYFSVKRTWQNARQYCRSIGAELAYIPDQELNEFVYKNLLRQVKLENECNATADMIGCWFLDSFDPGVILRGGASYKYEDGIRALYMNGDGSYADTPAVSLQFPAFTITCWVKVLEPAKTPGYIYADWSSPHQFSIWVHGDWKTLFFQFRNKDRVDLLAMYTAISFGVWIHVAVTWSQGSRIAKIFINGTEAASKSANAGLSSYEIMSNSHLYYQVGSKKDTSETFYGFVRDLKVFKKLLNDNEIKQEAEKIPQNFQSGVWFGLNDISLEGNYVWSNHGNGSTASFTSWSPGQPNSQASDEDCVVMVTGIGNDQGQWKVKRCDEQNTFVCWKTMP